MFKLVWEFAGAKTLAGIKCPAYFRIFLRYQIFKHWANSELSCYTWASLMVTKILLSLLSLANGKLSEVYCADWPGCIK